MFFSDIVLLLLRDECSEVRDTISQFIQCLRSKYSNCNVEPILPSLAEEHFIDWLDKQFRCLNPENLSTVWIQLIELQLVKFATGNKEVLDEVFYKSEANVFGETVLVCKKLIEKLKHNLTESGECAEDIKSILYSIKSNLPELFDYNDF